MGLLEELVRNGFSDNPTIIMALQFSDTTNENGIVQLLGDLTNTNVATSSSYPLTKKTRDINMALVDFMNLAIGASGKWQVDDTNHTDYNIMKIDVVSGQQDYPFTNDGSTPANQVLNITRVEIANASGDFYLLEPFDQTEEKESLTELATQSNTPSRYDKLANAIFLDPKPNYSYTEGLIVYYQRTPSYFATTDTTKKPGIPDMFHSYLAYKPAYLYAVAKSLPQANGYFQILRTMEKDIFDYYASRNKDEHRNITSRPIIFR